MKCAIVDDEPLALGLLESYVRKTPMLELCGKYSSAVEAMGGLRENPVDLLFLDIQMPELSGLDLSKMLDNSHTRIVFTTAFDQYAIDGYKVNALDYLLKPISYPDFVGSVSRAQKWFELLNVGNSQTVIRREYSAEQEEKLTTQNAAGHEGYIFVKSDYKLLRVEFDNILYVEGLKDYVKIYLQSAPRPVLSLTAMQTIEAALPSDVFFRIHRSFIVNMSKVTVMERGRIVFGEKYLPVSDSYKNNVQEYIKAHLLHGRS